MPRAAGEGGAAGRGAGGAGIVKGDRVIIYADGARGADGDAGLRPDRRGSFRGVRRLRGPELAVRIDDAAPKAILLASCGKDRAGAGRRHKRWSTRRSEMATVKPDFCLVLQRAAAASLVEGRDFDWVAAEAAAEPAARIPVGEWIRSISSIRRARRVSPKGVVRPTAGHMVALTWTMRNIYDIGAGDVFWAASDVGWVVGHSYICYAPLLVGATTIVFEGKPVGTPDAGTFWRVIGEHGVKSFFTAPTALRAIKREDPVGNFVRDYDLGRLKLLFLAGERADPDTIVWAQGM